MIFFCKDTLISKPKTSLSLVVTRVLTGLLVLSLAALSGCSSPLFKSLTQPALLLSPPLSPSTLPEPVVAIQQIRADIKKQPVIVEAAVNVSTDMINIIFLSPIGQRTSSLSFDGKDIEQKDEPTANSQLSPRLYLEALQFTYWPLDVLINDPALKDFQIEQKKNTRSVFFEGDLAIQIQYNSPSPWHGAVEYLNIKNNYRLTINSNLLPQ